MCLYALYDVLSHSKTFLGISGHLYAFVPLAPFLGLLVARLCGFCSLLFPFCQKKLLHLFSIVFCYFMCIYLYDHSLSFSPRHLFPVALLVISPHVPCVYSVPACLVIPVRSCWRFVPAAVYFSLCAAYIALHKNKMVSCLIAVV